MEANGTGGGSLRRMGMAGAASLAFLLGPGTGTAQAAAATCAPASATTIDAQFPRFTKAWATGSGAKVADLFGPGAVLLATVSNAPRTTRAGIEDYFDHFLKAKPVAHIDTSTTRAGCNLATRTGTWTITLTDPKTGAKSIVHARFSFVYRFDRGQWWIDHLHSSKMPEAAGQKH